jgi:hypothetical protein
MNEYEIEEAQARFADHAVLGPATATLAALVGWTNSHSDGWAYWGKPRNAARPLIELVQQGIRHEREAYQLPRTPEPTADQYRAALRALKSFRTRMGKTPIGTGADFPIYDPLPAGKSPRTFAAELAMAQATELHTDLERRERAALELRRRAGQELAESQQVDRANGVLVQLKARQPDTDRLVRLATPGEQVWLLPNYVDGKFSGRGHFAESLGMTGPTSDHLVVVKDAEHGHTYNWLRLYPSVVSLPDEAAEKWWVVDASGDLVTGGSTDRARMCELAGKQGEPCKVVQGAEFVPGQDAMMAPGEDCDECRAFIPDAEPSTLSVHHWPSCSLYPDAVAEVSS